MPTFYPGEEKTARVTVHNPTAKAFDYVGRFYLGTQQKAEVPFDLEADVQKDVLFPVTMPAEEGTYPVSIDVLVEGEVIATYKATEDVEIVSILVGDLDNDGLLTVNDLNILYQALLTWGTPQFDELALSYGSSPEEFFRRADINGDGILDAKDITALELLIPAVLVIDRFFALTRPHTADYGEFEIHCHVKNIGGGAGTHHLNLVGVMDVGLGYTKEINKVYEFTLAPGEVYDCVYIDSTYRLENVWVKAIGDWGEETPVIEFKAGYYSDDTELVATKIGSNYAILRYAHSGAEYSWGFRCKWEGIEYPKIKLSDHEWTTIYHLISGLVSGKTYKDFCAWDADIKYITFTTL